MQPHITKNEQNSNKLNLVKSTVLKEND